MDFRSTRAHSPRASRSFLFRNSIFLRMLPTVIYVLSAAYPTATVQDIEPGNSYDSENTNMRNKIADMDRQHDTSPDKKISEGESNSKSNGNNWQGNKEPRNGANFSNTSILNEVVDTGRNREQYKPRMDISYLFDELYFKEEKEEFRKGIRLSGSRMSYMGLVEVALRKKVWGVICGDEWTVEDATVVCRQLGLQVGNVIAVREKKFGSSGAPVEMSEVRCRGNENSLEECRAKRWDGVNSLPCSEYLRGAGVICGCPIDTNEHLRSKCFLYIGFPSDILSCHHSCRGSRILVGNKRRHCNFAQEWTGIRPTCAKVHESRRACRMDEKVRKPCYRHLTISDTNIHGNLPKSFSSDPESCLSAGCCYNISSYPRCYLPENSPCSSAPCWNGGECRDFISSEIKYECKCRETFGGDHCQYKRDWTCGTQEIKPNLYPVRPVLRVFGGRGAVVGSWPWVVQLLLNDNYTCAGTLIHRMWVMTAAHCIIIRNTTNSINFDSRWRVAVGRNARGNGENGIEMEIAFMIHNNFTNGALPTRDIALLKLSQPVELNNFVDILCLPLNKDESPTPGSKCWIAGWGRINPGMAAENLYQADVPIMSNYECKAKQDYNNIYHSIEKNMLCAGYKHGEVDACDGDSGGPLMCKRVDDGRWYVAGIVSWGYKCGDPNSPGVYTRVSHFLGWIHFVINTY